MNDKKIISLQRSIDEYIVSIHDDWIDFHVISKGVRLAIEIMEKNKDLCGEERKQVVLHVFTAIITDRVEESFMREVYISMLSSLIDSIVDAGNFLHLNKNQMKCYRKYCMF
jgi:hypothetical protein